MIACMRLKRVWLSFPRLKVISPVIACCLSADLTQSLQKETIKGDNKSSTIALSI